MNGGGRGDGDNSAYDGHEYRLVLQVVQNRETSLVIDERYRLFVTHDGEVHALPRNSFSRFLALMILGAVVAHQIGTSFKGTGLWFVSIVDGLFERVQNGLQKANDVFASKRTGRSLSNIKKVLVILAILLFLLDKLHSVDVTVAPKWFFVI